MNNYYMNFFFAYNVGLQIENTFLFYTFVLYILIRIIWWKYLLNEKCACFRMIVSL